MGGQYVGIPCSGRNCVKLVQFDRWSLVLHTVTSPFAEYVYLAPAANITGRRTMECVIFWKGIS